jgi:hypothetical protein
MEQNFHKFSVLFCFVNQNEFSIVGSHHDNGEIFHEILRGAKNVLDWKIRFFFLGMIDLNLFSSKMFKDN